MYFITIRRLITYSVKILNLNVRVIGERKAQYIIEGRGARDGFYGPPIIHTYILIGGRNFFMQT